MSSSPSSPTNYSRPFHLPSLRPPPQHQLDRQDAVASPTHSASSDAGHPTDLLDLVDFLDSPDGAIWRTPSQDEERSRPAFPLVVHVAQSRRPISPTPSRRESRSSILFDNPRLSFHSAPSSPSNSNSHPTRPPRSDARPAPSSARRLQGLFGEETFVVQKEGYSWEMMRPAQQIEEEKRRWSSADADDGSHFSAKKQKVQFEVMGIAL